MILKFNSTVRFRTCADTNLILLGKKKTLTEPVIYQINDSGKFICEEIKKKLPLDKLTEDYSKRFSLPLEQSQQDVLSYVEKLQKYEILAQ